MTLQEADHFVTYALAIAKCVGVELMPIMKCMFVSASIGIIHCPLLEVVAGGSLVGYKRFFHVNRLRGRHMIADGGIQHNRRRVAGCAIVYQPDRGRVTPQT